jgi:hypothetical protein
MTWSAISGFVQTASRAAGESVPTSGFANPASREAAVEAAAAKVVTQNWSNVRTTVVDKTKARASVVAQAWIDSLNGLVATIQGCVTEYDLPATLREDAGPLDDQFRIEAAAKQYEGYPLPMKAAVRDWNALEAIGADESRVRLLIASVRPLAAKLRGLSEPALYAMYAGRQQGEASSESQLAFLLLREMSAYEAKMRPASIDVAITCLHLIRDCFIEICGASHRTMSAAEFRAAMMSTDASHIDDGISLKISSDWTARVIPGPGTVMRLPGYTVPAGKSGMGAIVRSAPGGR